VNDKNTGIWDIFSFSLYAEEPAAVVNFLLILVDDKLQNKIVALPQ